MIYVFAFGLRSGARARTRCKNESVSMQSKTCDEERIVNTNIHARAYRELCRSVEDT